jgi:hypothetical protein
LQGAEYLLELRGNLALPPGIPLAMKRDDATIESFASRERPFSLSLALVGIAIWFGLISCVLALAGEQG